MIIQDLFEEQQSCPHCGGPMFSEMLMMEKKDACYYKVKASAKVWPSAYASGRLVQCRKKGAGNYGNKSESMLEGSEESYIIVRTDSEGKQDVFAGNFDTYERAQKELDACLAHPLHTKYKQKFEIKRKGQQGQQGVAEAGLDEAHHGSLLNPKKGQFASVMFQSEWDTNPQIDYYDNLDDAKFETENASAHHVSVYAWNGARWVQKMSATERTGGSGFGNYGSWEENKQSVAEEASPMIKPPANRFDNKQEAFDHAKQYGGKVFKSTYTDPNTGIQNIVFVVKKEQGVAEEYELAGVGVAYDLGRRAYQERKTARDNPYSATREARKNNEWAKGLERGKHDANAARHFRGSVREQGMAEAGDSNFVGFMNKTLADKVDSPKADPMSGAPDFYRNAAVSTLDARRGFKNALKFGLKALSRLDPETRQQLAAGSEQAVANYLTDVAERSGQMGDNTFVEEDITEVQDYLGDVFHDPSINSWKDVLQQSQGMSDGQLDEKSVSQAQFRTMAAAAHNPEFAKKVGIKQSVAKEFNQADKGSNYKKLPDRTNEGGDVFMANIKDTPEYKAGFATGKLPVPHPEGTQQYASYYKGVIDKASPTLNKVGEGEQQKGADYRDPPEADYGDDYQDMVARMKKLAGLGPLKTVYDPAKRVYRNMPTAVQPKK